MHPCDLQLLSINRLFALQISYTSPYSSRKSAVRLIDIVSASTTSWPTRSKSSDDTCFSHQHQLVRLYSLKHNVALAVWLCQYAAVGGAPFLASTCAK